MSFYEAERDFYDLSIEEILELRMRGDTDDDSTRTSSTGSGRQQSPPPRRSPPPQRPPPRRQSPPRRPPPQRSAPIQLQRAPPQRPQPQPSDLSDLALDEAIPIMKARGLFKNTIDADFATEKRRYQEASSRKAPAPESSPKDSGATGTQMRFQPQWGPLCKVQLREIDPLTHSLDEIIEKVKDAPAKPSVTPKKEESSTLNKRKRAQDYGTSSSTTIDDPRRYDKPIVRNDVEFPKNTPYQAVGFLTQKGMIIEMKIGQQDDSTGDRSHKWRCTITAGPIYVVADSLRKVVAREMAAVEFLQQLRQVDKDCKIPDYTIVEEIFISPYIFHFLEKEAKERCLEVQHETRIRSVVRTDHKQGVTYLYICTYFVGQDTYKGESYKQEYARLAAAKNAYEGLTGKSFLPTQYFTGGNCDPTFKYTFGESEVFQTVPTLADRGDYHYSEETPRDIDEAMRKRARTMLSERFKQSQKDEEKARRNMPVNMQPLYEGCEEVDEQCNIQGFGDRDEEDDDEEDEDEEDDDEEDEDEGYY